MSHGFRCPDYFRNKYKSKTQKSHERKDYQPTTDQQEVASALQKIPAMGIDYDEWVKILMAIHHAYGDQGLPLAEQWAQGTPGEVQRK